MRTIEAARLGELVETLCLEVSTVLPEDVAGALLRCRDSEESRAGRQVIDLIIDNARAARELKVPICQDTGVFSVFLDLEEGAAVTGDLLGEVSRAVARATLEGALRPSVVEEPVDGRVNTGDNTPPVLEIGIGEGETSLGVMAKGGGSEMASRAAMLKPGAGWEGVLEYVVGVVAETGPYACPPLVMGVGIGGSFDRAPVLAKRALLRPLDRRNPDGILDEWETRIVERANLLGIGPGAMGGTVTCMGARIEQAPCHMANLPVAVSLNCHALRRKVIRV